MSGDKQEQWGKKEVDEMLEDLRSRGEYQTRQDIKRSITDQDPELNRMEMQMINLGIMCVTSLIGIVARRMANKMLEKAFA
jgi:hypothetical protein